jgi:uncharacterized membrane protein HdeD (DUF308 family)
MDLSALLASIMDLWHSFPSLSVAGKIAGCLVILIGLVKSSLFKPLWDKAGPWKALVAPLLGLIVAVLSISPFNWAGVLQGLAGGVLAVGISQVFDAVKLMPGVGQVWITIIDVVQKLLGAPKPALQAPKKKK